jgi:hypothetical protein
MPIDLIITERIPYFCRIDELIHKGLNADVAEKPEERKASCPVGIPEDQYR